MMVYYHGCTIPCHCLIVLEHGSHLHFDSDCNAVGQNLTRMIMIVLVMMFCTFCLLF